MGIGPYSRLRKPVPHVDGNASSRFGFPGWRTAMTCQGLRHERLTGQSLDLPSSPCRRYVVDISRVAPSGLDFSAGGRPRRCPGLAWIAPLALLSGCCGCVRAWLVRAWHCDPGSQ